MNPDAIDAIVAAANGGKWWVFSALIVGLLVRLLKAKPALAEKFPPRVRPWLAVGLGIASGMLNKVVEGTPWKSALLFGASSGAAAVLGHEFLIESILGGREIGVKTIPEPGKKDDDDNHDGGVTVPAVIAILPPPEPPTSDAAATVDIDPRPTPKMRGLLLGFALIFMMAIPGCSLFTKENAKSALDAAQIACVFGTELMDEHAVADACGIARDLIPVLRNLIGQREAARRVGVRWPGTADGGGAPAVGDAGK